MAIIYDNQYHKITRSINDFVDNTTNIEMDVYGSADTRETEKRNCNDVETIKVKINSLLQRNMTDLIDKTNKIKPINEIVDVEQFYRDHPEIKEESELVQSIQDEGLFIEDKLSKEPIKFKKLKHKDIWAELGLNEQLCEVIDYRGTEVVGVEGIRSSDLKTLYDSVKEKIVSEVTDC